MVKIFDSTGRLSYYLASAYAFVISAFSDQAKNCPHNFLDLIRTLQVATIRSNKSTSPMSWL